MQSPEFSRPGQLTLDRLKEIDKISRDANLASCRDRRSASNISYTTHVFTLNADAEGNRP